MIGRKGAGIELLFGGCGKGLENAELRDACVRVTVCRVSYKFIGATRTFSSKVPTKLNDVTCDLMGFVCVQFAS